MSKYRLKEKKNIFRIYGLTLTFPFEFPYNTIFPPGRVYIASRKPVQYFCGIFINLSKLHFIKFSLFSCTIRAKNR